MLIRNREFDFDAEVYIMGILNVTPDSFSDGGKHNDVDAAVNKALEMINDGADIIDIGGESTRPGFKYVDEEEEIARVIPVVKKLREVSKDIVISVDTTKSEVARQALLAGADIINDVSGFLFDNKMAEVAKKFEAPCILMHDGNYFTGKDERHYREYIDKVVAQLGSICQRAIDSGIQSGNIIVDPGVGFGKSLEENLEIIRELDSVVNLGFPVLLGCSRKSVIGKSLNLPIDERVEGTITTSVIGAMNGAAILRVHDVKANFRAIKMLEAIFEGTNE